MNSDNDSVDDMIRVLEKKNAFTDKLINASLDEQENIIKREIIALVDPETVSRYIELTKCFSKYGLVVRDDSMLCRSYIQTGAFQGSMTCVEDICKTMFHAEYLAKVIKVKANLPKRVFNPRQSNLSRPVFNKQEEERAISEFKKIYKIEGVGIDDAIKYVISNKNKFDLTSVNANQDNYPW
jgi:hypothetical protein